MHASNLTGNIPSTLTQVESRHKKLGEATLNLSMVGLCRLYVSKPVLKAPMVSALEAKM
jgi:hypothetical protein